MMWDESIQCIWHLHGVARWAGIKVAIVAGQRTINESKREMVNTREYAGECQSGDKNSSRDFNDCLCRRNLHG